MKQVLQDLKTGEIFLQEVPVPHVKRGHLLIQSTRSLISAGTERMYVDFGRAGYISKAKQRPEKVKQVLEKIRTDGLLPTVEAVLAKLEQPNALGYCNVGRVLEVGEGVEGFRLGDRVASNGGHAEVVMVPVNLCAKVPEGVSDDQAAFTVISAIGLHAIRLLDPSLGESVAVFGLGLIGLIAIQILAASGVRVIGFDNDPERVRIAQDYATRALDLSLGSDPVQAALAFSSGVGVDGVLITASTPSHELIHQAAEMCRKRGRIILTGVVGLNLRRSDFYHKELTFQVSCSYGPGRYDPFYEEQGHDYPLPYVRWTEKRNFEAVLELMREGRIEVDRLISRRVPLLKIQEAYDAISSRSAIGVLVEYPVASPEASGDRWQERVIVHRPAPSPSGSVVAGVIGAGNFARLKTIPLLAQSSARLKWIASSGGLSAAAVARKIAIERSTTDYRKILEDPEVNAVIIATRHDTHAQITVEALEAGKSVFVEKPLCLNRQELEQIVSAFHRAGAAHQSQPILMVDFNRRFSPLTTLARERIGDRQAPLALVFTCNAGPVPADHWVHDPQAGGGRIVGEACHFIDLLHFLVGAPIFRVSALKQETKSGKDLEDTVSITLKFQDGSLGQINYFAGGSKRYPKEQLQIFSQGRVLFLDNFKRLQAFGFGRFKGKRLWVQDKGHRTALLRFLEAVEKGQEAPISFESIVHITAATFAVVEAMREEKVIELP